MYVVAPLPVASNSCRATGYGISAKGRLRRARACAGACTATATRARSSTLVSESLVRCRPRSRAGPARSGLPVLRVRHGERRAARCMRSGRNAAVGGVHEGARRPERHLGSARQAALTEALQRSPVVSCLASGLTAWAGSLRTRTAARAASTPGGRDAEPMPPAADGRKRWFAPVAASATLTRPLPGP